MFLGNRACVGISGRDDHFRDVGVLGLRVEATKLDHHDLHASKVKHRGSQHESSVICVPTFRASLYGLNSVRDFGWSAACFVGGGW